MILILFFPGVAFALSAKGGPLGALPITAGGGKPCKGTHL